MPFIHYFCLVSVKWFVFFPDSTEIYDLLLYTRKAINPDLKLTRYDMPKAGLNLFAQHCALFAHFLIDIYEVNDFKYILDNLAFMNSVITVSISFDGQTTLYYDNKLLRI